MMRQMRENTRWIMLVTAIAFVGLMVFEWGMDASGRSAGGLGELGRVNGTPVTYEAWQAAHQNLYDQVSNSQEEPVTAAQRRQIEEQAWNDVVNQILISQELDRRGIRVTDQEIMDAARFSPPQAFLSDPLFMSDGRFDIQKYQDFLATSADEFLQLETYYRDIIPRSKLLRQVSSGIYFTDSELWDQYRYEHEQVRVQFAALDPLESIPDDAFEVTEAEIQAYYRENEESFAIPARAEVKYVTLTKSPLREDTASARLLAEEARQAVLGGEDFAEVARRESSDQITAPDGGDLGTFARGQMVPTFDSVVFSAPLNQVTEPIETSFGFHVIQVLSREGDSAQARHILIPIERTNDSELRLLELADSLEALGETMTIEEAGRNLGLPVMTQTMTEIFPFLAGAGQISDGLDWVFEEGAPGEVSPVFEDPEAFYMMELVSSSPAGSQPVEEARPIIDQILRQEKKVARASEDAVEMVASARAAGDLTVLATEHELMVQGAGPLTRLEFFPGMGIQTKPVGAAFGLEEGLISDPVETRNNVFIVQTLEKIPADSAAWEEQKAMQRAQAVFTVQQQRLEQWIMGMREASDIVDRREEVFQASNDQAQAAGAGGLFY
ncbi:peptidylprolyl isomerase [Gemmatimonadota bacterium]